MNPAVELAVAAVLEEVLLEVPAVAIVVADVPAVLIVVKDVVEVPAVAIVVDATPAVDRVVTPRIEVAVEVVTVFVPLLNEMVWPLGSDSIALAVPVVTATFAFVVLVGTTTSAAEPTLVSRPSKVTSAFSEVQERLAVLKRAMITVEDSGIEKFV